jgi:outer membrane protein assembly factor BamB
MNKCYATAQAALCLSIACQILGVSAGLPTSSASPTAEGCGQEEKSAANEQGVMARGNAQRTGVYLATGVHSTPLVRKSPKFFAFNTKAAPDWINREYSPTGSHRKGAEPAGLYGYFTTPVLVKGVIYLSFYLKDGYLMAVDASSGRDKWLFKKEHQAISAPAIVGDTVYVGVGHLSLYALDATTGTERGRFTAKDEGIPFERQNRTSDVQYSSPVIASGTVYFTTANGSLYALDAATLGRRWVSGSNGSGTAAALEGNTAYFAGTDPIAIGRDFLKAVDTSNGHKSWEKSLSARSPVVTGKSVYFSESGARGEGDFLGSVNASTGSRGWKTKIGAGVGTHLALAGGSVYFCGRRQNLYAFDAETGLEKWTFVTKDPCDEPVVADGIVYTGGFERLYAVDAKTGRQRWAVEAEKTGLSSPAVADGAVYSVSDDGRIYAIEERR